MVIRDDILGKERIIISTEMEGRGGEGGEGGGGEPWVGGVGGMQGQMRAQNCPLNLQEEK